MRSCLLCYGEQVQKVITGSFKVDSFSVFRTTQGNTWRPEKNEILPPLVNVPILQIVQQDNRDCGQAMACQVSSSQKNRTINSSCLLHLPNIDLSCLPIFICHLLLSFSCVDGSPFPLSIHLFSVAASITKIISKDETYKFDSYRGKWLIKTDSTWFINRWELVTVLTYTPCNHWVVSLSLQIRNPSVTNSKVRGDI